MPTATKEKTKVAPAGFVTARVLERAALTPVVERFKLSTGGGDWQGFTAGSHIELLLPLGGEDEVRHYSVCSVDEECIEVAVLREEDGRGGSRWMHEQAHVGSEISIRGPRNTFPFTPEGAVYFIAGGIGITPFLSMIDEAERNGVDWQLLYLGRETGTMAFAEMLAEHGDRVTLWNSAEKGRADLRTLIAGLPHSTLVYACGPDTMQQSLRTACAETGHVLVIEDFNSGKSEDGPVTEAEQAEYARPSLPFTVELADGTEVDVPADQSIIDALNDVGIRTLSSCRRGTCGTCETPILEGEADHRDSVLSEEEKAANETMMICVSRACGDRIVLDL